ncbi:hypothetical protein [Haloarchaeobius sp. TZWWS8]
MTPQPVTRGGESRSLSVTDGRFDGRTPSGAVQPTGNEMGVRG